MGDVSERVWGGHSTGVSVALRRFVGCDFMGEGVSMEKIGRWLNLPKEC